MHLSAQLQRLAFVQDWGDGVIQHILKLADQKGLTEEETDALAQSFAQCLTLDALRGGATILIEEAAGLMEMPSLEAFYTLMTDNPALSHAMNAAPGQSKSGKVVAISMTEVVFQSDLPQDAGTRYFAFEKARGGMEVNLHDFVTVNRFGHCIEATRATENRDEPALSPR